MPASLKLIIGLFRFVRELIFGKEDQTVTKRRKMVRNIISALVVLSILLNVQLGTSAFKLAHTIYQNKQKINILETSGHVFELENQEMKKQVEILQKELEAYRLICTNGGTSAGVADSDTTPTPSAPRRPRVPTHAREQNGPLKGDTIDSIRKHLSE